MVGNGRRAQIGCGSGTPTNRLQADPAHPVARRVRLKRHELEAVKWPNRAAGLRLLMSHHLCLVRSPGDLTGPPDKQSVGTGQEYQTVQGTISASPGSAQVEKSLGRTRSAFESRCIHEATTCWP